MAPEERRDRPASYRYGAVLALVFALLVLQIAAPSANWSRAIALGLQGMALMVVVATSRERATVRRDRTAMLGAGVLAVVVGVAFGAVPSVIVYGLGAVMGAIVPIALIGGLIKLVRTKGVTVQVVAGALVIYLVVGLIFAWTIGAVAHSGGGPYFAQGTDGSQSERVYYSFTVLTTTGFGDLTAATQGGRAIAVVEMLLGQLYLVTVIGILVGDMASRRRGPGPGL
jgi:ion channel